MKKETVLLIIIIAFLGFSPLLRAQVSINDDGSPPHASAMLEIKSNNKGLLIPRMSSAQRIELGAIATAGLIVYDTDLELFCFHNGMVWVEGMGNNSWGIEGTNILIGNDTLRDVTIGTINPLGKLHVHDPLRHNSKLYISPMSDIPGDSATLVFAGDRNASSGMYFCYNGGGDRLELRGLSAGLPTEPQLLVDRSSGNIAIGNTFATGYKLSVSGKVICTELRVNLLNDWPDYVFSGNYKLMPLDELRQFIEFKGHLPNIPAASEMQDSGIDVGEMQRLMMEKIEELSLYILQQQDEIKELRGLISKIQP